MIFSERNKLNPTKHNRSYGEEDFDLLQPIKTFFNLETYTEAGL